jgi:hypothetical protein
MANGDTIGDLDIPLDAFELGYAVPAIETGTLNKSAAILIQAGFNSRLAAIKAVTDTGATFVTGRGLRDWLLSEAVEALSLQADWPTPETKPMWIEFVRSFAPREDLTWANRRYWANVAWNGLPPAPGTPIQIYHYEEQARVLSAEGDILGTVLGAISPKRAGLLSAQVAYEAGRIDISYLGPADLLGGAM